VSVVTVLGAGAMGAALTRPAADAGNQVRLWGTWLDDALLAELRAGRPHPRTGVPVDPRVRMHDAPDLAAALDGADLVAIAVRSEGVLDVLSRAAPQLARGTRLLLASKGFGRAPDGRVRLLPPLLEGGLRAPCPVVAVAGPCKANEVAAGRPTAAVFACRDMAVAAGCAKTLGTAAYRVQLSDDVTGVEVAAATKNVYAIALGACDGLADAGGQPWHDLAAAAFTQAVGEMRRLAVALGGRDESVLGLAGVGDLEVTRLSGRNQRYGARLGRGEAPGEAEAAMSAAGQTVEGIAAARLALELAGADPGMPPVEALPLLAAVVRLLDGASSTAARLAEAVLPAG
jgi:glycerol-3-phosphate dehydrogenase (NAD(P)+)